jgi:hypothetical protein
LKSEIIQKLQNDGNSPPISRLSPLLIPFKRPTSRPPPPLVCFLDPASSGTSAWR